MEGAYLTAYGTRMRITPKMIRRTPIHAKDRYQS